MRSLGRKNHGGVPSRRVVRVVTVEDCLRGWSLGGRGGPSGWRRGTSGWRSHPGPGRPGGTAVGTFSFVDSTCVWCGTPGPLRCGETSVGTVYVGGSGTQSETKENYTLIKIVRKEGILV